MSKVWSSISEKRYIWLYNRLIQESEFKNLKQEDYLLKINKRKLISFIKKSPYSLSTKESWFFMIVRWLEMNDPDSTNISMFREIAYKYKKQRDEKEGENKKSLKEEENYQDRDYFLAIIKNTNTDNIKNISDHYKYLLLCLLTLQPPLRSNFYVSAKFATSLKEMTKDENYIYLAHRGKDRVFFIVNKDKVSNTKTYKNNDDLSQIEIKNNFLVEVIYKSYKTYPRKYLFQSKTGGQIKEVTLLSLLRSVTHLPAIDINTMRSIYINWWYDHHKTYNKFEELAKMMRSSVQMALKFYRKINRNEDKTIENIKEALKDENNELKIMLNDCEEKLRLLEPDKKLYNKRRSDIIYHINQKKVVPRATTLKKYNITFDETQNKYI